MFIPDFFNRTHAKAPRCASQEACIPQAFCARTHYLVKLAELCVAQNEVARDVWRPVAPVIPNVRRPVAAVGEAKDGWWERISSPSI